MRFDTLPEKLPRYPIPVILLGRFTVDIAAQGQKLGEALLLNALKRAIGIADQFGIYALEAYALTESARTFYQKYGFIELSDDRFHLYLPLKTIKDLRL